MPDAYYFGCVRQFALGHYFMLPDLHQLGRSLEHADRAALTDLGPRRMRIDGLYVPEDPGVWAHGHTDGTALGVDGWTYLAAQDFTVDTRPGSHSTFLLRGHHTARATIAEAARLFPSIAVRVGLNEGVKLVELDQLVCPRCHRAVRRDRLHTCEVSRG